MFIMIILLYSFPRPHAPILDNYQSEGDNDFE